MTWVKIDDAMPDHPKMVAAGPCGFALHVAAVCYANRTRSDGVVPEIIARKLLSLYHPNRVIRRLVEVGAWEPIEDGYRIVNYARYQRSSEEIEQVTERRRQAGIKGAESRWKDGKPHGKSKWQEKRRE